MSNPEKYPWLRIMMEERGVREVPGRLDNARIVEYLKTTDYDLPQVYVDEIPWCSGFENWGMEKAGFKGTGSASSQSWLDWGREVEEQKGAVVIFSNGDGTGHVGTVYDANEDGIFVIGGNQKDSVCISFFSRRRVAGYRLPEDYHA